MRISADQAGEQILFERYLVLSVNLHMIVGRLFVTKLLPTREFSSKIFQDLQGFSVGSTYNLHGSLPLPMLKNEFILHVSFYKRPPLPSPKI